MPSFDECLGLEIAAMALWLKEPDGALAANAVADDSDEWLFCERNAHGSQCGGKAGVAGGSGGYVGYGVHLGIV
jgi:hypothetical protein